MATLNEKMQLARDLFGRESAPGEVRAYATATANSTGGTVSVDVGGEVVDVPVLGAVARGQEVILQVQNGHPVALGVAGWGDSVKTELEAVTSYVWQDSNGAVHVTAEPEDQQPDTGVTINAEGVEIEGPRSYVVAKGDGVTVGANGADALIISSNAGAGGCLIGSPVVVLSATTSLHSSTPSNVQAELHYLSSSQAGVLFGIRGNTLAYEATLGNEQYAGPSATALTRVLDLNPADTMPSAFMAKYGDFEALKLGGKWLRWRTVAVTVKVPSGFDSRSCIVMANDGARLLYVNFNAENSGGSNVSVPANTSLFTCTDTTLRPTTNIRAGAGFRYNGAALLDFPVKTRAGSPWALIGPAWAFSAASIHFDALIPYDALGIA